MTDVSTRPGWIRTTLALAACFLLTSTSQAVVLDDFTGSTLDPVIWEQLGPKSYTMSGGFLTFNDDQGDWAKGEIATQEPYFLPPVGEMTTVTWVMGTAAVTTDNGERSVRIQMGLVSDNETADTREHWGNTTGGIWLDGPELLTASNDQVGIELFAANDTKTYGGDGTLIGGLFIEPWNWQTETTEFRVEITSESFTWYHNATLLGTYTWAEQGIDSEFANGFHIWVMGQNNSNGRGSASVDRIEIDNPITGPGLISSFRSDPPNVIGGETAILRFEVDPAATVTIAPDIGTVPHVGGVGQVDVPTEIVESTTTILYTLTATVGAVDETRETSLTVYPVPEFELADFADEFDGDTLDTDLWETRIGSRAVTVSGGQLVIEENGGNWGHGQVATLPAYKLPGPGESTDITFVLGPSTITVDTGGDSLRIQVGIVSGNETDGWSLEHWKNTTGGVWLDLTGIQNLNSNSVGGAIIHANDTKQVDSNGTEIPGGAYLGDWNWQTDTRTVTLRIDVDGFIWLDEANVLGGSSWDAVGLDTEFLAGYRIIAVGLNMDTGRGVNTFDAIRAASVSGTFGIVEFARVPSGVELAWEVEAGATYTVQRAGALDGAWDTLPMGSDLTSDTDRYTDTTPTAANAYYQVIKTPPPPLLKAGFEPGEDLSGWTEVPYLGTPVPVWDVGVPVDPPAAAHTGTHVYGTVLDGNYTELDEVGLRTPVIDLTGVSQATLRFYHWYALEDGFDYGRVHINDSAGNRILTAPIGAFTGASDGWELAVIPIPTEAIGQQVQLEFYLFSDTIGVDRGWYIDDVEVK